MRQLDLFADSAPRAPAAPPDFDPAEVEDPLLALLPDVLPGQVGLFDDRNLRLGRGRAAIAAGRLEDACLELDALRARYPGDLHVERDASRARDLLAELDEIDAAPARGRAAALLPLTREIDGASEPWASLRRVLLSRLAVELRREHGDAGDLDGHPPGYYLIEAGDFAAAHTSLAAAVALHPSARLLFLLADTTFALGDADAARRLYLDALLVDPFDDALRTATDERVRSLPDVVRYELEIDDEPAAWSAPAGILTGVLPRPAPAGYRAPARTETDSSQPPGRREALDRARGFVAALVAVNAASQQGSEAVIEARRGMKHLSPELFTAYMDRIVRGRTR